jgi:hypothetical protein
MVLSLELNAEPEESKVNVEAVSIQADAES